MKPYARGPRRDRKTLTAKARRDGQLQVKEGLDAIALDQEEQAKEDQKEMAFLESVTERRYWDFFGEDDLPDFSRATESYDGWDDYPMTYADYADDYDFHGMTMQSRDLG